MSLPLDDALRQCDRHAQRMSRAMARIPFPLDGHELAEDNENLITLIDQFVFRQALNRARAMSLQLIDLLTRLTQEFEQRKTT